jgi:hypothetical protein
VVTLSVTAVNDMPVATNTTRILQEDTAMTVNLSGLASDVDGDTLTAAMVTGPLKGTVTISAAGVATYTPTSNYFGVDSFTYRVNDGQANSAIATVFLTITAVNDAPLATNDSAVTLEDQAVRIAVLTNDSDVESDALRPIILVGPIHGTLVVEADGRVLYTPTANYFGIDSFTYQAFEQQPSGLNSNVATVSINVTAVNDAPTVTPISLTVIEDTATVISLPSYASDVDGDTLAYAVATQPTNGSLTSLGGGQFRYTPAANYFGSDSFSFTVSDGTVTVPAQAFVTVTAVNDAPVAVADLVSTGLNQPLIINVLANDSDVDSTTLTPIVATNPANGSLVVNANGTITYTPQTGYVGSDIFSYRTSDGLLSSNIATVSINVVNSNRAPVVTGLLVTTNEDTSITIAPLASATDPDGDALSISAIGTPTLGTLLQNANGSYTFTPALNVSGSELISFTVTDGRLSTTANINLTISPVNDAPSVGATPRIVGVEDQPYVFAWNDFNAADVDSSSLSVVISTLPLDGVLQRKVGGVWQSIIVNSAITQADIVAGNFRLVPDSNESGSDTEIQTGVGNRKQDYARFDYKVSDGSLQSGLATMVVDVIAVADTPTLTLTTSSNLTRDVFRTGFESATNPDIYSTAIQQATFEGWTLITTPDSQAGGINAFEVWTNGDQQQNFAGTFATVSAKTGNGSNFLELNNATVNTNPQTLGIERTITTVVGNQYTLSFDYAGRPGFSADYTRIGAYVDGVKLATYANTSPATSLNWQALSYRFTGTGGNQAIRFFTEATLFNAGGRGAMIDNIALIEPIPLNQGLEDSNIRLSTVVASLTDADGSETLAISMLDVPAGGTLTDGTKSFTATSASTSVVITGWTLNNLSLLPPLDFSGNITLKVRAISTEATGGLTNNAFAEQSLVVVITPMNDAPVVGNGLRVVGVEDQPYVFAWGDFKSTDVDNTSLSIKLESLPANGVLQRRVSSVWQAIAAGDVVSQVQIVAGDLRFVPSLNESGIDAEPQNGVGNRKQDYARFNFSASDGSATSTIATMTVDIAAVADAPTIAITNGPSLSTELFRTGFESAANSNNTSTAVQSTTLEGWTLITTPDSQPGGINSFEIWSAGDIQANAANANVTVAAKAGNGANFLELNNASSNTNAQTLGIQRTVATVAGTTYTLSFDYAGRPGFSADYTRIGIYVDGVKLATYANTSPNSSLNWQTLSYTFVGTGGNQVIRFVTEATLFNTAGRGAMIDNIALAQMRNYNTGALNSTINLSSIAATLADVDGSESLKIEVGNVPVGARLSDGANSFTATATLSKVDVTVWNRANLTIVAAVGYLGNFSLSVIATAMEANASGALTSTSAATTSIGVTVHASTIASPIAIDLNGDGVRTVSINATTSVFDLLNTGVGVRSGWIDSNDAFLARDLNGNGMIDSRAELFGGSIGEGYSQLSALDSNIDGVINASDKDFALLRLWQDKNSNKQTDLGELTSLNESGIAEISLAYQNKTQWQNGNLLIEQGTAKRADGSIIEVRDAYFEIESAARDSTEVEPRTNQRIDNNPEVRIPAGLLKSDMEEVSHSAFSALLRRDERIGELPWPIRAATAGLVQSTKPVIDWNSFQSTGLVNSERKIDSERSEFSLGTEHLGTMEDYPTTENSYSQRSSGWLTNLLRKFSVNATPTKGAATEISRKEIATATPKKTIKLK